MSLSSRIEDLIGVIQKCPTEDGRKANVQKAAPKKQNKKAQKRQVHTKVESTGNVDADCMNALAALGMTPKVHEHTAVNTSVEHLEVAGSLEGVLVKNKFMKQKRAKPRYLFVFAHDREKPKYDNLGRNIGCGKGLRDSDDLEDVLNVKGGCVTPVAVMNDSENVTMVVVDAALKNAKYLKIHPCVNTKTICLTPAEIEKFVTAQGCKFMFLDFDKKPEKKKKQKQGKQKKQKRQGNEEGMTYTRKEDFGMWYKELVEKADLIDYTDISGCYVLKPASYFMWEKVRAFMDPKFQNLGVQNCYFPLFVSKAALFKEKDHVEGFTPEVAWVTKSGETDLADPIAVRPTSETIMYPLFKKWIRSYQDLPLKINQWCNVVRWEFKNPTPFLRTREFLWQEGHTAFETFEESKEEVYQILDIYAETYKQVLAVPTVKGVKTELERFPGGHITTTVEAYIPGSGRSVQGGTSHSLGQNFGKMFNIRYEKETEKGNEKLIPWQNSWGFTTRSLGVAFMNHSDDKGLVVPPRIAIYQIVIIPIPYKNKEENEKIIESCRAVAKDLKQAGFRVLVDESSKKPGWKYNNYELKGVPLRLEIGIKDVNKGSTFSCRRDTGKKEAIPLSNLKARVGEIMNEIHDSLYARASKNMYDNIVVVTKWNDFLKALAQGKLCICPSANTNEVEQNIKNKTKEHFDSVDHDAKALSGKAKSLCIPLEQDRWGTIEDKKCIESGQPAKKWILYGRSY